MEMEIDGDKVIISNTCEKWVNEDGVKPISKRNGYFTLTKPLLRRNSLVPKIRRVRPKDEIKIKSLKSIGLSLREISFCAITLFVQNQWMTLCSFVREEGKSLITTKEF